MSSGLPSSPTWSEIFQRILCTVRAWRTWRRGDIAMSCEGCGSLLLASERTKCDDCVWAERMTAPPITEQHAALYAAMQNAAYQQSADQLAGMLNMPIGAPIRVSSGTSGQLFGGMISNIGDLSGMLSGRPRS